jgi:2-methylcitrate dehydratase PrpD
MHHLLSSLSENHLREEQIKKGTLGISNTGFPIIVEPEELKYNPVSIVDAQFIMPFGAAVAIIYEKVTLDEYTSDNIESQHIKETMKKVLSVQDPDLDNEFPKKWLPWAKVQTDREQEHRTRIEYPKGDPENPLSWEELISRFRSLTAPVFRANIADEIIVRNRSLEKEKNTSEFLSLVKKD